MFMLMHALMMVLMFATPCRDRGVHPKNRFFQRSFEPKPLIPRESTMLIDAKNAPNHNQTLHTTCTLPGRRNGAPWHARTAWPAWRAAGMERATHEQQHTICAWHAKRDACPHQAKPHTSCNTGMTQTKLPLMAGRTHLLGRPRGRSTSRPLLGGLSASRSAPGGSRPSFEEVEQLLRTAG